MWVLSFAGYPNGIPTFSQHPNTKIQENKGHPCTKQEQA